MLDQIRYAAQSDIAAICDFYKEVCAANETEPYGPVWHYGIYPSEQDLREHLERNELVVGLLNGNIVSAMVLTDGEDPIYAEVPWKQPAKEEEITVLHLFAVLSKLRGCGVSAEMMNAMFALAAETGKKRIHLDVVKGNVPAERLYQRIGFAFVCEMDILYEDTGNLTVELYEYDLTKRDREHA